MAKFKQNNFIRALWGFIAKCHSSVAQTLTTAIETELTLNFEDKKEDLTHSLTTNTNRVTIPTGGDGDYMVYGTLTFASFAGTPNETIGLSKNGTAVFTETKAAVSGQPTKLYCLGLFRGLVATDYISLHGTQASGGNLATVAGTVELHVERVTIQDVLS